MALRFYAPLIHRHPAQHKEVISPLCQVDIVLAGLDQRQGINRDICDIILFDFNDFVDHFLTRIAVNFLLDQGQQCVHTCVGIIAKIPRAQLCLVVLAVLQKPGRVFHIKRAG